MNPRILDINEQIAASQLNLKEFERSMHLAQKVLQNQHDRLLKERMQLILDDSYTPKLESGSLRDDTHGIKVFSVSAPGYVEFEMSDVPDDIRCREILYSTPSELSVLHRRLERAERYANGSARRTFAHAIYSDLDPEEPATVRWMFVFKTGGFLYLKSEMDNESADLFKMVIAQRFDEIIALHEVVIEDNLL